MAAKKVKASSSSATSAGAAEAHARSKPKNSTLSDEMIVDSGSEDESDGASNEAVPSKSSFAALAATMLNGRKAGKKDKASTSSEDGEDTSSDEDVVMDDAAAEGAEDSKESEESEEDSEDDSSKPPPSAQKTRSTPKKANVQAPKVNGVKRKTPSEATISDQDEEQAAASKKARIEEPAQETATSSEAPNGVQPPAAIPAQEYVPPPGYRAVAPSDMTAPVADLAGKTVWHISAPANVPLSSIASLTKTAILSGKTALSYKNVDYTLTEVALPEQAIFLPGKEGYKAVRQAVKKTFTLRPTFTLPTIPARAAARDAGSLAAGNIATASVLSVRPQPKGLKMRYKPPGFGRGNPGVIGIDDDDQADRTERTFQFPRAVGLSTDGDGTRVTDGSVKKKKKDKDRKSLAHVPNGLADHVEPQAIAPTSIPAALDKIAADVMGETLTPEEKARRKAEKKAKKAAKRQSQAEAS